MIRLPTVLLRHETRQGAHYDWMLADPETTDQARTLWTARVDTPTRHWTSLRSWRLRQIQHHRQHYLTYQGSLAPRQGLPRGTVRRVDRGWFVPLIWTRSRIVLDLRMRFVQGRIEARRVDRDLLLARCLGGPKWL